MKPIKPMKHITTLLLIIFSISIARADIRKFDQATIEKLGVAIYEQDIRAATATDMLFAKVTNPVADGLRGWIVEGDAKSMLVRFIRQTDSGFEAYYDVVFEGKNKPVLQAPKDRKLTAAQLAQYKARTLAIKNIKRPVSKNYNFVILPDPEKDGFLVYALAATTVSTDVMVGGHYRFTISKDGEKLLQSDELFKTPMVLSTKPKGLPPGASLAALTMTTLVSDMPLETHVYLSLLHKMPFYVGTPNNKKTQTWKVEKGKIEKVDAPSS